MKCVTTVNAKIHAKQLECVVRMLCASLTTMSLPVNVPLDLKVRISKFLTSSKYSTIIRLQAIQHLNKAAFVSHQLVWLPINVQPVICVSVINATYHVPTIYLALLVNVVPTTFVQRFATQTTTVYLVKFAMTKERVSRVVHPTVIVQQHKCVSMANANAVLVSLERRSVALTSTNVLKSHVIRVPVAKTRLVRSDVFVLTKKLEIHTAILVAYNRTSVAVTMIVLIIWLALKENALIHAPLHNVEEVLSVKPLIIKLCAIVLLVT